MPKEEEQVELCILAKEASALKKKLEDERQRVNDASCKFPYVHHYIVDNITI